MLLKVRKVSSVLELLTVLLQEAQSITVAVGTDFSHGLEAKRGPASRGQTEEKTFYKQEGNNKYQKNQRPTTGLGQVITASAEQGSSLIGLIGSS